MLNSFHRNKSNSSNSGATMVEAAIVLPLLILLILFFIDVCRYVLLLAVLNGAASIGVDYAAKLDFGFNFNTEGQPTDASGNSNPKACNGAASQNPDCRKFQERLQAITNKTLGIATTVAKLPGTGGMTQLVPFTMYRADAYTDENISFPNWLTYTSAVGFLRPGERIVRSVDGNETYFDHQSRQPLALAGAAQKCRGAGWPSGYQCPTQEAMDDLFVIHPLIVRLEASMRCFTPLMGSWNVQATQMAFRRSTTNGVSGAPLGINPLEPTPIYTATPTPRPFDTPDPNATQPPPQATVTPRPTSTPRQPPDCSDAACEDACSCQILRCDVFCGVTCLECLD